MRIHPHELPRSASTVSCAYTQKQLVLLFRDGNTARYMYIRPHEQLCSASAASCAYTQEQRALMLLNGNTTHYALLVGRRRAYHPYRCMCHEQLFLSLWRLTQIHRSSLCRRFSPATQPDTSICTHTSSYALPLRRHAHIHRNSLCCCSSTATQPGTRIYTRTSSFALPLRRHAHICRGSVCRSSATHSPLRVACWKVHIHL